jgi:antitoxin (DNA-binding transcriptional repressor) of toxin-antitoxin stability system
MTTVSLEKAGSELADLIRRARAGEEIIIADDKQPLAKLIGIGASTSSEPRKPGALKGRLNLPDSFFFEPLPEDDLKLWWGESQGPR